MSAKGISLLNPNHGRPPTTASVNQGVTIYDKPQRHQGVGVHPVIDGHPHRCSTDFYQPLRVVIWHGLVLGVHESLWVRDRFW